ncbi:MAG: CoB--CoM heterodisulfide reductase iron-sulfur subunit A family protein [Candidatus Altiarchaeota archaeon]
MRKHPRIGVFVCHCGKNIAGVVDVKSVRDYAKGLPYVVEADDNLFSCSESGQKSIADSIKENNLERVIVASCTPRMHEPLFRKVLENEGLNPYLFEMVNIREQASWVHAQEKDEATKKAKDLIRGAVMRAVHLVPLTKPQAKVVKAALVLGGGVAGIFTSLNLAKAGVKTYLVEKKPSIGGNMALLDKVYPALDCSQCVLSPKMVEVKQNPNIELLEYSEVTAVEGHVGNFRVTVKRNPRHVSDECVACDLCAQKCPVKVKNEYDRNMSDRKAIYIPYPQAIPQKFVIDETKCLKITKGSCGICEKICPSKAISYEEKPKELKINVGAIVLATGFHPFDAERKEEYGYKRHSNVITNLDFERLVNSCGPTEGHLRLPSDGKKPRSVAFIQCVGSRDEKFKKYCSSICCNITLKQAALVKEKIPESEVYVYYIDMRTVGKGDEEAYQKLRKKGVTFIRGRPGEITETREKTLKLITEDVEAGLLLENEVDLVVLAAGFHPPKNIEETMRLFHVQRDPSGFLVEAHPNLRPTETDVDGVYLAGCTQFPKNISDSVAQAGSAAANALDILERDIIEVEGNVAEIDHTACVRCRICERVCPFDAISYDKSADIMEVAEILCKGCGLCNAACFSGAIQQRYYKDNQLLAQVKAILSEGFA